MVHSGLQFKDTVYPGREVMVVELEVDWSHCNHNQEAGSRELSFFFSPILSKTPAQGMELPTVKIDLLTSLNLT